MIFLQSNAYGDTDKVVFVSLETTNVTNHNVLHCFVRIVQLKSTVTNYLYHRWINFTKSSFKITEYYSENCLLTVNIHGLVPIYPYLSIPSSIKDTDLGRRQSDYKGSVRHIVDQEPQKDLCLPCIHTALCSLRNRILVAL